MTTPLPSVRAAALALFVASTGAFAAPPPPTPAGPAVSAPVVSAPKDFASTREMADLNWMEFKELVPSKVDTVLLPTGTLEPHGVANNGADITAPVAMARRIAPGVNAMIAPALPYGITGSMEAYPGAFQITESAYRPFVKQILEGLAKNGFRNIIVLNGHGGPETAGLYSRTAGTSTEPKGRTLDGYCWSIAPHSTKQNFCEGCGHRTSDETALREA